MLIVAADRRELQPLAARLAGGRRLEWGVPWSAGGRLGSLPVALVAGGVGRSRAAAAVRTAAERAALRGIVSTGWCGALDPSLGAAEIVIADRVLAEGDGLSFPAEPVDGPGARGAVLTVNSFVATAEEKQRLRRTGAIAVEMEAAAVAAEAGGRGVPFFCVRAVSDTAGATIRLGRHRLPDGELTPAGVIRAAGFSPARWADLVRLWRGASAAANALGEFLARCRFAC